MYHLKFGPKVCTAGRFQEYEMLQYFLNDIVMNDHALFFSRTHISCCRPTDIEQLHALLVNMKRVK